MKKNRLDEFNIQPPAEQLRMTGESMINLAENLGGDRPLDTHDKALIRMAYVGVIEECFGEMVSMYVAGHTDTYVLEKVKAIIKMVNA